MFKFLPVPWASLLCAACAAAVDVYTGLENTAIAPPQTCLGLAAVCFYGCLLSVLLSSAWEVWHVEARKCCRGDEACSELLCQSPLQVSST